VSCPVRFRRDDGARTDAAKPFGSGRGTPGARVDAARLSEVFE
jgi:hypothetical protein